MNESRAEVASSSAEADAGQVTALANAIAAAYSLAWLHGLQGHLECSF
jgi:hypothetical protein